MPDFPSGLYAPPMGILSTTGSSGLCGIDDNGFRADIAGNVAAFPAANRIIYCPVYVEVPVTVFKLGWGNGALNGTAEVGIYNEAKARLVTSGAVTQAGAAVYQFSDITDTALAPGVYYFAMVASTVTTATYARSSINATLLRTRGCAQEALSALPATASFTALAASYLPVIIGSLKATI